MSGLLPASTSADWDQAVACYLSANPGWLSAHPDLYRILVPPARVFGDHVVDHMAAMVRKERELLKSMTSETAALVAARRSAETIASRIQEAVASMITAADITEFVAMELPRLVCADVAALSIQEHSMRHTLECALGSADLVFGLRGAKEAVYLEGSALALQDVLIRVPAFGVLAIGARSGWARKDLRHAQSSLIFLGRMASGLLMRDCARPTPCQAVALAP